MNPVPIRSSEMHCGKIICSIFLLTSGSPEKLNDFCLSVCGREGDLERRGEGNKSSFCSERARIPGWLDEFRSFLSSTTSQTQLALSHFFTPQLSYLCMFHRTIAPEIVRLQCLALAEISLPTLAFLSPIFICKSPFLHESTNLSYLLTSKKTVSFLIRLQLITLVKISILILSLP